MVEIEKGEVKMPNVELVKLREEIIDELRKRLEGTTIKTFVKYRASFEGWLKVEIVDILHKKGYQAVPEKNRYDIVVEENGKDSVAIQLKTIPTNYTAVGVERKTINITNRIDAIVEDVKSLKVCRCPIKFLIFVVFPIADNNLSIWKNHLKKIVNEATMEAREQRVSLCGCFSGNIYLLSIGEEGNAK